MNNIAPGETSWPMRKIIRTSALIFLVQAALLWLLGQPPGVTLDAPKSTAFLWLAAPLQRHQLLTFVAAPDPDVLSLPSIDGFSGPAWLKLQPVAYEPPRWDEPPQWLKQDRDSLTETFISRIRNEAIEPIGLSKQNLAADDRPAPLSPTERKSSIQIAGELVKRALPSNVQLRSWTNDEPLLDSIVEVAANPAGSVVSARLLQRSGKAEADEKSLAIARTTRFKPSNDASVLTFGKLVFSWQTLPETTNQVTTPAVSPQGGEENFNGAR